MKRTLWFYWVLFAFLFVGTLARPSYAYSWMIRHEYTGCAVCHTDPSGGFLLTAYGRAQTQTLLSTFGRGPEGNEVDKRSDFLFGVTPMPTWLNVGGSLRYLYFYQKPSSGSAMHRSILMQSDVRSVINVRSFEFAGSLGFSHEGGYAAQITRRPKDNLVAREFWLGYNFDDERNTRLRLGRLYMPFGIRTIDHTLFVRNATQTDLDSQQQWGASLFHGGDKYRIEVMAVLGNYQMRPDKYRQRGYSGYLEYAVANRVGAGFSSLLTYQIESASSDITGASVRGAHGPFLRYAPIANLALMSEWDVLHEGPTSGAAPVLAMAGFVQADWEFYRGLHAVVTPELYLADFDVGTKSTSYRGWLTAAWYAHPHVDIRADAIYDSHALGAARANGMMALGQVHISL